MTHSQKSISQLKKSLKKEQIINNNSKEVKGGIFSFVLGRIEETTRCTIAVVGGRPW